MSTGALLKIRQRISDVLAAPVAEALAVARSQPVVHRDETNAPTGNADGANPDQRKGWLCVLVTPVLTVFQPVPTGSATQQAGGGDAPG